MMRGGPKTKLGDRELAALADLLTGRSVELPRQAIPFERRGLLDPASTQHHLTLDEAVIEMSRAYEGVKRTAVAAEDAWNRLLDPLDALSAQVRGARAIADQLQLDRDPLLDRLGVIEHNTVALRKAALSDPLGLVSGSGAGTPAKVARLMTASRKPRPRRSRRGPSSSRKSPRRSCRPPLERLRTCARRWPVWSGNVHHSPGRCSAVNWPSWTGTAA
jgi:hypothetical protein